MKVAQSKYPEELEISAQTISYRSEAATISTLVRGNNPLTPIRVKLRMSEKAK